MNVFEKELVEKLRDGLSAQGVPWSTSSIDSSVTTWNAGGERFTAHVFHAGLRLRRETIRSVTPDQAVSLTVGSSGTCSYVPEIMGHTWVDAAGEDHYEEDSASPDCGAAYCDKCGEHMLVGDDGWFEGWDEETEWTDEQGHVHRGYQLMPRFAYCPGCGRKVMS